jgi:hypothetical protein
MGVMATGGKRKGRTRVGIAAIWLGGLAATAIVAGCDGNSPPEQSGMQRLAGRDFDNLFFWNEQTPAFTRQTTAPTGAGSQDFWVWPDGENAPLRALSQIDWSPPSSYSGVIAGDLLMTGLSAERVYDLQTRSSVDLQTIAARSTPGGLDWTSLRRDGGSIVAHVQTGELLAGRGSTFTFLPPAYVAWGADFMGDDLAVLASPSRSEPASALIYRMALPSGDISPLPVPPLLRIFPRCVPLEMPPCKTFRVLGCGADDAVCAETGRAPCAILYLRADAPTDVPQPYVFDVNTGQETALPAELDPSEFVLSPDRHSAAWMYVYDSSSSTQLPAQTPIYIHNFCSGAAVQCPLVGPQQITWRSDSRGLAVDLAGRQLGLVDIPTGTCSVLGAPVGTLNVALHTFSPGGDRLAWTAIDAATNLPSGDLWVSDAAGREPRMVASDVFNFTFSPDGQALFITRASGDQLSLSWLSLAADSPPEQLIADAFGGATRVGNQRVLVIDHWNTQDGSGNLELVDLASGTRQVLAHAVTDQAGSSSVDGAARVMYAVHGRFASAQDGLWQTTLPAP